MGASSVGAIIAILAVVIFSVYIVAGGITGLFISAPDTEGGGAPKGETPETAVGAGVTEEKIPEETKPLQESPHEGPQPNPCQGVVCSAIKETCPDKTVVSCQPACDPETGQCSSCSPDCSGYQAASSGGGGGGGPPPAGGGSGGCTDETWTIQGNWSECSGGKQTATFKSNCGSTRTETRDCTYISPATLWVSPETKNASITDNIRVDVKINTTEGVFAGEFKLYFDNSILNAEAVIEGGFLKQGGADTFVGTNSTNNNIGEVYFGATRFNTQEGISGEGVLATITFSATGIGASQLNLQEVQITDPQLQIIAVSVSGGTIEVS